MDIRHMRKGDAKDPCGSKTQEEPGLSTGPAAEVTPIDIHNLPRGFTFTRVKQEKAEVHQNQEGSACSRCPEDTKATYLGSAASTGPAAEVMPIDIHNRRLEVSGTDEMEEATLSHFSDLGSAEEVIEYLGGRCLPMVLTLASFHNLPWSFTLTRIKQEKVEVHQDQEGSACSRYFENIKATFLGSAASTATKDTEAVLPLVEGTHRPTVLRSPPYPRETSASRTRLGRLKTSHRSASHQMTAK